MKQQFNHSFSFIIFPRISSKADNSVLLFARITVNGRRSEFSIQRSIPSTSWDSKKGRAKGNSIEARKLNSYINEVKAELVDIQNQLRKDNIIADAPTIKRRYLKKDEPNNSLLDLFEYHQNHHFPKIKEGTKKHFRTLKTYTEAFLKNDLKVNDIYLATLSYSYLVKFENFLLSKRCPSKTIMKRNTAVKHIQRLKTIINLGIKLEWLSKNPFVSYVCTYDKVDRGYLSQNELDSIERKEITIPRLQLVRDLFVFSCYCGLAYVDVIELDMDQIVKGIDNERWIFTRRGKNDNLVKVPLLPTAARILDYYSTDPRSLNRGKIFPKISNQKLNAYLKEIAIIASVDKNLTFHLARHTFATTVTLSNGVPIETVSKLLGHTQISTTQIYARVIDNKISNDMKALKTLLDTKKSSEGQNENSNVISIAN